MADATLQRPKRRNWTEVLADRADKKATAAGHRVGDAQERLEAAEARHAKKSAKAAKRRQFSNNYNNPSVTGRDAMMGKAKAALATVIIGGLGVIGAKNSNFDFELPELKLGFDQVTEQRRAPSPGKDFIVFTGAYTAETKALEVANEYNRTSGIGYTGYDFEVLLEENSRGKSYYNVVTYTNEEGCSAMKQLNTDWRCFSLDQ